jgi:hypothetical protein
MESILRYLHDEAAPEEPTEADLRFLRTARVMNLEYWIWEYVESNGAQCYVTVSRSDDGRTTTGYDENYDHLTPEQYMLEEAQGLR